MVSLYHHNSFICPRCNTKTINHDHGYSNEFSIDTNNSGEINQYDILCCLACGAQSLICLGHGLKGSDFSHSHYFVDPRVNTHIQNPEKDMPDDVQELYDEASKVFGDSPRGGTALLRLALQKLLQHFEVKDQGLDQAIRSLAKKSDFNDNIIKVADSIRITGNNAVHPGQLNDEDIDELGAELFSFLNYLVHQGITKPTEINNIYKKLPEKAREEAERKDAKNKKESFSKPNE